MKAINRIKKSEDFAFAIKNGTAKRSKSFVIHFIRNSLNYSRIGVSVSSKLGCAVIRNRIKRQIREMVKEIIDFDKVSYDIVIIAKSGFLTNTFFDNKDLLARLLIVEAGIK